MWAARSEDLSDARGLWFTIDLDSQPASFADVIHAWQSDVGFRSLFNSILANVPYSAFRWETPSVTAVSVTQAFEFVILDSPGLARRPDQKAFAKYLADTHADVAVFPNLGEDAILVVPTLIADPSAYGHLAAFVRLAPEHQQHSFWQSVGETMARRVGEKPVWLNTAGTGVSWLHVRLDDRPKYYGFERYRQRQTSP